MLGEGWLSTKHACMAGQDRAGAPCITRCRGQPATAAVATTRRHMQVRCAVGAQCCCPGGCSGRRRRPSLLLVDRPFAGAVVLCCQMHASRGDTPSTGCGGSPRRYMPSKHGKPH
jgi:hypothetical protein